ncbi:putative ABC transport system ATP-binding protein [Bacillus sp. V-88]|jgi:ATP-binding cassette, subfamily B, bacterial|uniref:ATP-binding cassette domain-containing protein n=1 Tax=Rossellomorea vietnamensis TaxID=218284 RepID=A0A6I6UVA8_9BACI|nr:ABC transporter ATP-binding protein [Rossellomorea vietnamensis]OXS58167.1 hypothetical protein B1B00_14555 [Bacillus sp. DSM 27956]PRX75271.1 putative ABC transport system ATP-binding protein [Bacillus sp. V-88]QHE62640.1 ATP-binding cassette domain-containing protein [Rossellomorea vietnamensis]SLK23722.1 putative ABC transport system ATP-binding protein [Bacillus sp. V-88]
MRLFLQNLHFCLKHIIKATKVYFFLYCSLVTLTSFFPVIQLIITTNLINDLHRVLENDVEVNRIFWLLGFQFSILFIREVLIKVQSLIELVMSQRLDFYLQKKLLNKLIDIDYFYFEDSNFLNHLERIRGDVGSRFLSTIKECLESLRNLITLITILTFLFSIHWSLIFIPVIAAIPAIVIHLKFGAESFHLVKFQSAQAREQNYIFTLFSQRNSNKELRTYNAVNHLIAKWAKTFKQNNDEVVKLQTSHAIKSSLIKIYTFIILSLGTLTLVLLYINQKIRLGDLVASLDAIQKAQVSISGFARSMTSISTSHYYVGDIKSLITLEEMKTMKEKFPENPKEIRVSRFSFTYPGTSKKVLKDISFTAGVNQTIMIVGENGAGKSTLMKCLLGLYKVQDNTIMVNGNCINKINKKSFMENISIIFQDFIKYEFSVNENIQMGVQEKNKKVESIARKAGAHSFIKNLPSKYQTRLGRMFTSSIDLSGGQWQKVALARALYKNSPIIILDEPTSALDPGAEHELFKDFKKISQNKITFYISHRMYSCHLADKILVLKDGELVESGTHDELMNYGGNYRDMYLKQASMYKKNMEKEKLPV